MSILGGLIKDAGPVRLPLLDRLKADTTTPLAGAPAAERGAAVRDAVKLASTKIASDKHAERAVAVEAAQTDLDALLTNRLATLAKQVEEAKAAHAAAVERMHTTAREARDALDVAIAKQIKAKLYPPVAKWAKTESRAELQTIARVLCELDAVAAEQLGEIVGEHHLELAIAEAHAEHGAARWVARGSVMVGFDMVRPALDAALAALRAGPDRVLLAAEPMRQLECRILEALPTETDPEVLSIMQGYVNTNGRVSQLRARREAAERAAQIASVVPMPRPTSTPRRPPPDDDDAA